MAPGDLQNSSRHASVISVRFCVLKVPTAEVLFGTFGPKMAPGRSPKITKKSTLCQKWGAEESVFVDFCCARRFSRFFVRFWLDLIQKSMFFRTWFPHAARAFFEMATLTIV